MLYAPKIHNTTQVHVISRAPKAKTVQGGANGSPPLKSENTTVIPPYPVWALCGIIPWREEYVSPWGERSIPLTLGWGYHLGRVSSETGSPPGESIPLGGRVSPHRDLATWRATTFCNHRPWQRPLAGSKWRGVASRPYVKFLGSALDLALIRISFRRKFTPPKRPKNLTDFGPFLRTTRKSNWFCSVPT